YADSRVAIARRRKGRRCIVGETRQRRGEICTRNRDRSRGQEEGARKNGEAALAKIKKRSRWRYPALVAHGYHFPACYQFPVVHPICRDLLSLGPATSVPGRSGTLAN